MACREEACQWDHESTREKGGHVSVRSFDVDLMTNTNPAMARLWQGPAAVVPASDAILNPRHVIMLVLT